MPRQQRHDKIRLAPDAYAAAELMILRLVRGQLTSSELPAELAPPGLSEILSELYRLGLSAAGFSPHRVEWGACLVVVQDQIARGHSPVQGTATGVGPACCPEGHPAYVGFAHTHPPDEYGPLVGLSAEDFRATVVDGDSLAMACNGPEVFALVRSADCTVPRTIPSDRTFGNWRRRYSAVIRYWTSGVGRDEAFYRANEELCERLGFAFYRGEYGQPLKRIFRPARSGSIR